MGVVRDTNRIPQALKALQVLAAREVQVGIFGDAPKLVAIATQNEFGTEMTVTRRLADYLHALAREHNVSTDRLPREGERLKIPERSFMRSTFDEKEHELAATARELLPEVVLGERQAYDALRELGELLQKAVIERVRSGSGLEPNDPLTVAVKGHSRPLIGKTGVLETTKGIRLRVVRRE